MVVLISFIFLNFDRWINILCLYRYIQFHLCHKRLLLNLCAVFRLQWVKNKNSFKVKQRKQNVGFVPLKLSTLIWSRCLKTHKKGKWGKYIIFKCKQWIPSHNEKMVVTVIIDECGGIHQYDQWLRSRIYNFTTNTSWRKERQCSN